jgi:nicotinic acid mononucleotide adenylyltransferase
VDTEEKPTKRPKRTVTGKTPDPIDVKPDIKKLRNEAVIAFGKFNPPHAGHERLINEVRMLAEQHKATPMVFLSHGKGLLEYREKLDFCQSAFGDIIVESDKRSIFEVIDGLQETYGRFTIVVGMDRYDEFKQRLSEYYDNVSVWAIERPEGSESSSLLRSLAESNNLEAFKKALPDTLAERAEELFETVSLAQRRDRSLRMKRLQPRLHVAQERSKHRRADDPHIKTRAMALARRIVRTRIAGEQGRYYQDLKPTEKLQIDKLMARKVATIQRLAARLTPTVRRIEFRRFQSFMMGAPIKNLGAKGTLQQGYTPEDVAVELAAMISEKDITSIEKKANQSGIDLPILEQVFVHGLLEGDAKSAFQRVNSFIAGNVLEEDLELAPVDVIKQVKKQIPKVSDKVRFIMFKHKDKADHFGDHNG